MAIQLDEIDVRLLKELETDADRPNVELARIVGLSPAATLNRVRRLKESGVIRRIAARLDSATAGFSLQVYLLVTLAHHDERAEKRFNAEVAALDNIISADTVAGETDAILMIVARDVAELHVVLSRLSTRGGAQRLITLLRLGRAQAVLAAAAARDIRPVASRGLNAAAAADHMSMEIQANAAMMIQANSLEAIRDHAVRRPGRPCPRRSAGRGHPRALDGCPAAAD